MAAAGWPPTADGSAASLGVITPRAYELFVDGICLDMLGVELDRGSRGLQPTQRLDQPIGAPVEQDLEKKYSPEQITGRQRVEFPDDPEMRVSPETIYQSI